MLIERTRALQVGSMRCLGDHLNPRRTSKVASQPVGQVQRKYRIMGAPEDEGLALDAHGERFGSLDLADQLSKELMLGFDLVSIQDSVGVTEDPLGHPGCSVPGHL